MLGSNFNSFTSPVLLSPKVNAFCMLGFHVQHHEFRDNLLLNKQHKHQEVKIPNKNSKLLVIEAVQHY